MQLFKCKVCGAELEVMDGAELEYCPYCGMKQTLPKDRVLVLSDGARAESLLRRAYMFLEDGEFAKAGEYCDRVLDIEPENARAYLCKLMGDYRCRRKEDLAECASSSLMTKNTNYPKVLRFGDDDLKNFLAEVAARIEERERQAMERERQARERERQAEEERKHTIYKRGLFHMKTGNYYWAGEEFDSIYDYRDAADKLRECHYQRGLQLMNEERYSSALREFDPPQDVIERRRESVDSIKRRSLKGYKDSDQRAEKCRQMLQKEAAGCMTFILQALTFTSLFIIYLL